MNLTDWYVDEALRQIERRRDDTPESMAYWRTQWRQVGPPPRRALLAWLGDRLVGFGERLRDWSTADPAPAVGAPHERLA